MDRALSEKITAWIAGMINEALYIRYTPEDVKRDLHPIRDQQGIKEDITRIFLGDEELYYVMQKFCTALKLKDNVDEVYLRRLFEKAKKFTVDEFYQNEYLRNIKVPEKRIGRFLLTNVSYERGEFFQYAMPNLREELVVPYVGFCNGKVWFPAIYEGEIPWVSVCPSEISSMQDGIDKAHGRCLVLGMGLAYYAYMISLKDNVKSVTIVERQPEIITLFTEWILPQFSKRQKIRVVLEDAFTYMENLEDGVYDFCYADIWENQYDGADAFLKIDAYAKRMPFTQFEYWIEDAIRWECRMREPDEEEREADSKEKSVESKAE